MRPRKKIAPIKRGIACLVSLFVLLSPTLVVFATVQGGTLVHVQPPGVGMEVGETVEVEVVVNNVTDLRAVEVQLIFDSNVLQVVDADTQQEGVQVQLGPFLQPGLVLTNTVDQAAGQIHFSYRQETPESGASGSGALAKIGFHGQSAGDSPLALGPVILASADGTPIQTNVDHGHVTVLEAQPPDQTTPSPTVIPTVEPGPTATPPPPTPCPPGGQCDDILGHHAVQPGEWVYAIARAYRVRPDVIAICSNLINPNLIYPGNQLAIPNAPWTSIPPGPAAQPQFGDGSAPVCAFSHTVQPGETLFSLSSQYGVSMWEIAEANQILNLQIIQAGQVLCIP